MPGSWGDSEGGGEGMLILVVGESRELVLPGLGTAGYRWFETVAGDVECVTISWRRGISADEARPIGASAPERLEITATAPGHATIQLAQRRPWEHRSPREERRVDVEVVEG